MPAKTIPTARAPRRSRKPLLMLVTVVVLLGGYTAVAISRPVRDLRPSISNDTLHITTPASNVPWPAYGQSAYGLADGTVIASHGDQTPVPTASAAKLITALVILQKKPLTGTAAGPSITFGPADVAIYNNYVANHGSIVPISSGQSMTERQALEAMLIPSGNNIADSLAIWAYGSLASYKTAATSYLHSQGLHNTSVGSDASGLAPDSTSTATDLVRLGALAEQSGVVAQIVNEPTTTIPGVGLVHNVNTLLGSNGIVGVKTGNNDQDMGVFIGAAQTTVAGKLVTVISAVAGGPSLSQTLADSANILAVARASFATTTIVSAGTVLGTYRLADGGVVQAVAPSNLSIVILRGDSVTAHVQLKSISYNARAGSSVGSVSVPPTEFSAAQQLPIILKQAPTKPSLSYRLLHP